jgi:hypothetical protein
MTTTGVTSGVGTAYPSGPSSSPGFRKVSVARSLVFWVVICRSFFVPFLLVIMLSVLLQLTDFGLFLNGIHVPPYFPIRHNSDDFIHLIRRRSSD